MSKEAQGWWRKLATAYDLTPLPAQLLLGVALEAYDRMRAAQAAIKSDGLVQVADDGKPRTHPAAIVERDSRGQLIQALKALNLAAEVFPLHPEPGRPPGSMNRPKTPGDGPERYFQD